MIKIALIGEIGSGKTFISRCFKYPSFNADAEVAKIYKTNIQCFKKLKKKFPKEILNFPIEKRQIRKIISKKNIKKLSKIVHPFVRLSLKKFLKKYQFKKYVILDIPLLIENKLYNRKDILIYVKTKKSLIVERLKKRKNYNKKIINILKKLQDKPLKKIKLCHFTIYNNADKKNILKQIEQIKKKINDRSNFRY